MAADKNVPQMTQIFTLLGTDLIYIPRPSTGEDCFIAFADFQTIIGQYSPVTITCINNSTTQINLGNFTEFNACSMDLFFTRGDTRARKQIIEVFQLNAQPQILEGSFSAMPDTEDEDCGITLSVVISSGDILLNIAVDNSDANDVILDYVYLNKR